MSLHEPIRANQRARLLFSFLPHQLQKLVAGDSSTHSMSAMSIEPPSKRSKMGNPDAGPSTERENPYLAHLAPKTSVNGSADQGTGSNGVAAGAGKNPLNGLVPRMVTTQQAKNIMVS